MSRLPDGFAVALDGRARVLSGGAVVLGGSPMRLLRLAPAARRLLAGRRELTVRDPTSAALARRLLDAGVAHPVVSGLGGPSEADVTVVVPVRDRPDGLRRLLAALDETAPGLAEVIVVDDGSASDARPVDSGAVRVRWIRHPRSLGPAAARNTGLAAARTEYVAFLDSDVVPLPGWLAPLRAHLADRSVALVAPRIVALPGDGGWLDRYERARSSLDLGPDPAPIVPRTRVAYVPSAALLARRDALGDGFDPDLPVAEDVDLVLRLHAAGRRLRYEPSALVAHCHRTAPLDWWTRKAFYGTGAAPLALRHPGSVPPAVFAPWAVAACLLLGTGRRPGMLAAAGLTAASALRLRRTLGGWLPRPWPTAARLTGHGLRATAAQVAGLLVRHWWPLAVPACLISRRIRRAALAAALAEGLVDWYTHRRDSGLDPVRYLLAHRADDLAYGAGLWWGAWRGRTLAPLLPVITRPAREPRPPRRFPSSGPVSG
ncbi:mycofactocin biosynthesis glycosyltransferase MftF [Pseudonocardia acaciae]|uniref:mycofactocin biosynthesis glycosyltransferase MftF n=1 Tax=Pseudonocardia acaciae TaxID=551276 RepID=UPI000687420E|nr:mycofactocin biosynthesis glycosyltransferase MftF [Pseudonocardia acaciae]